MKSFNILLVLLVLISSCKQQEKGKENKAVSDSEDKYLTAGAQILPKDANTGDKALAVFERLQPMDTVETKISAVVTDVCQAKGCWMKLELSNGQESMVRFKDYGFFVPKDIVGKEVIVRGKAFIDELSVEDQRHYAEDAGKTKEEVAAITQVKKTYGFEADGVLIPN